MNTNKKMGRNPFEKKTRRVVSKKTGPTLGKSQKNGHRSGVHWVFSTTFFRVPVFSLVCAFKLGSLARGFIFQER